MLIAVLRWIGLVCTGITLGAGYAHVLELPNKFRLDGELWLAVQQTLYRGWGPFIGPFELLAIAATWLLVGLVRGRRPIFALTLVAALCLSLALVAFFTLNAPVNTAFAQWTAQTLPADWPSYRLRWEVGHAVTFVLALIAFILLLRAAFVDAIARARRNAAGTPGR